MKNNLKRLHLLISIFGSSCFYNCEATTNSVTCMGKYDPNLLLKALKYKFKLDASPNGYLWLRRGKYLITLTD